MKKINNMTVFESNDKCSLDEYSGEIAKEVPELIKKAKEEVKQKVIEISENDIKQDTEIATLKNNYTKLQEQNTKLESQIKKDRENMINLEVEGQSIHVEDSSDLEGQLEVLGNVEQETSMQGKNKLDLRQANYTVSGVNVTKNNSKLTLNGTLNASDNILDTVGDMDRFIYFGKFKVGTYRFSKFIISGKYTIDKNIGPGTFACYIRKKDKTLLAEIRESASSGTGITITLQEDTDLYIQIFCNKGAVFENYTLGFQLEEGDKTTDFEQFVPNMPSLEHPSEIRAVGDKGSVEIRKQNENFFNKNNANILNAYIGASKGNIVSGTYHRTVYLKVNKGTYTITKHKGVPGFVLGYTKTEPKLGDIVENLVNAVGKTTETISVENGYLVINIYVTSDYNANYTVEDILNGLKIELGKVSTEYTEHQEQTKILPIQKPMLEGDYFNRVDNKEVHTWKKIILDGVNNKVTQMNTNQSGKWRYEYKSDNLKNCSLSEEKAYCTHLPLIRKGETADNIVGFTVVYNGIYIYTNGETAEEFNTKLQTNNITFYIPVIESAYQKIDLTPEQAEVLDQLDNFPTYKPVTNITTDSIAKLKLKYIADTKTYIDNKVNNLEQQVGVINQLLSTTKTSSVLLDNLQTDIESEVL